MNQTVNQGIIGKSVQGSPRGVTDILPSNQSRKLADEKDVVEIALLGPKQLALELRGFVCFGVVG